MAAVNATTTTSKQANKQTNKQTNSLNQLAVT